VLVAVLGATLAFSLAPRIEEYQRWHDQRRQYFAGEIPISGADSYYFLRMARLVADYAVPETDRLRHYPSGVTPAPVPALSRIIAKVAQLGDGEVYGAGLRVTVLLSSLFVAPMLIACWRMGLPAAGVLGALLGSFSPAYFYRSSLRNVDTDGGNLFFVWLLAASMLGIRPDASQRTTLALAAATGLALAAFVWWYDISGFWIVYLGVFSLHLLVAGFELRRACWLMGVFVVCSNPLSAIAAGTNLYQIVGTYLFTQGTVGAGALAFPNALEEIDELTRHSPVRTLETLTRSAWLSATGTALFCGLLIRRWRQAVPLLPIALLGALGLVRASRFAMYLAPLVGVGLGAVLSFASRRLLGRQGPLIVRAAESTLALVVAALLLPVTAYHVHVANWSGPALLDGILATSERLPPDGAILATWHLGYVLSDVGERASFDDGMAPDSALNFLFSHAITDADPRRISELAGFMAARGRDGLAAAVADAKTPEALLAAIGRGGAPMHAPVALLLHGRMLREFPVYFRAGQWNFERGEGPHQTYEARVCTARSAHALVCRRRGQPDLPIDLERGRAGDRPLRRVLYIGRGRVVNETEFAHGTGHTLQLLRRVGEARYDAQFIAEEVYASNFNQLFVLGRLPPGFELLVDHWPSLRSYRIPSP
jgi:dolichyl-diphosphooligosaccharide--protein glycosyltransferase